MAARLKTCESDARSTHRPLGHLVRVKVRVRVRLRVRVRVRARTTQRPSGHRALPSSLAVVPPSTMYTKDVTRSETLSQYTMRSETPRWVGIRW
jgi:hypothetical protein